MLIVLHKYCSVLRYFSVGQTKSEFMNVLEMFIKRQIPIEVGIAIIFLDKLFPVEGRKQ